MYRLLEKTNHNKTISADRHERLLLNRYGALLDPVSLTEILGYPSVPACRQALYRGTLPLPATTLPGRRSLVIPVRAVAEYLAEIERLAIEARG